eukprot:6171927-Pleurochrysis_carterae.AAC.5
MHQGRSDSARTTCTVAAEGAMPGLTVLSKASVFGLYEDARSRVEQRMFVKTKQMTHTAWHSNGTTTTVSSSLAALAPFSLSSSADL